MGDVAQTTLFQSLRYGEGGWEELRESLKAQNACLAKDTHCCVNPTAAARSAPNG